MRSLAESVEIVVLPEGGGDPVEAFLLTENGERHQWLRIDEGSSRSPNPKDNGWRLRLEWDEGEGHVELMEEQVLPERVLKDARNVLCQRKGVRFNLSEALWLRRVLDQDIIPMLEAQGRVQETADGEDEGE